MSHFTTDEVNRLILMKEYIDEVQFYPAITNENLCAKMRLIEHFAKIFQKDHGPIFTERVATQNAEETNDGTSR